MYFFSGRLLLLMLPMLSACQTVARLLIIGVDVNCSRTAKNFLITEILEERNKKLTADSHRLTQSSINMLLPYTIVRNTTVDHLFV